MRRISRDARGLSEIVGTLMLVVIVVGAAIAFSIFVASYEAQVTAEEAIAHDRSLESIRVLSVATTLNATSLGTNYSALRFTVGSLDVNTMTVNELLINGQFVNFYTVTPIGTTSTLQVCEVCDPSTPPFQHTVLEFNMSSEEQATIVVNLTVWNPVYQTHGGFLDPYNISTSGASDYVSISLYTTRDNVFTDTYTPPTAVIQIEQSETFTGGSYVPVVVLDGTGSVAPTNDTIVSWSWTITPALDTPPSSFFGAKVLIPDSAAYFTDSTNYTITLVVTDATGLDSTATFVYAQPA